MMSPLPVNRRARTWYGSRIAPTEPLRHEAGQRLVAIAVPQLAPLALPLPQAPFDRRLAALL